MFTMSFSVTPSLKPLAKSKNAIYSLSKRKGGRLLHISIYEPKVRVLAPMDKDGGYCPKPVWRVKKRKNDNMNKPPMSNVKSSTPTKMSSSLNHMSMISSIGNLSSICSTSQLSSLKLEQVKRAKEEERNRKLMHKSCFQIITYLNAKKKNSPIDEQINDLQLSIENKRKALQKITLLFKMVPILKETEETEKSLIKMLNEMSHASLLNQTVIQNISDVKEQLNETRSRLLLNNFSEISAEKIAAWKKSCENILNELEKHENNANSMKNMEIYKVMSSYLHDVITTYNQLHELLKTNENLVEQMVMWNTHKKSTNILHKNLGEMSPESV